VVPAARVMYGYRRSQMNRLASLPVSSMLFETTARDPLVFAVVAALLLAVAAVASMAPALRAARIDPIVALRAE
jgi:putative ABC transport system permease protein